MGWINSDHNQDEWMALVSMAMVQQSWRKYWQTEPVSILSGFWTKHKISFFHTLLLYFIWSYGHILQTFKNDSDKNPMRICKHVQNVWMLQALWKLGKRNCITERNRAQNVDNIWTYLSPLSFCIYTHRCLAVISKLSKDF